MAAYAGYRDPGQGDSLMAKKMAAQHRAAGGATTGSLSARSQASAHRTVAMALEPSPASSPRQPEVEELAQTQTTLSSNNPSIRQARTRDIDRWKFSERKHLRELSEIKTRSEFAENKYTIPFCEAHSLHIARGDKIDDETAAEILDYYYTDLAPDLGPGLPGQTSSQRHRQSPVNGTQSGTDELDGDTLRQLEELDTEFLAKKNRIQDKYGAKRKQNYCLATDYRQLMEASRGIPMHYSSKNASREGDGLTDAGDEPPAVYEGLLPEIPRNS